MVEEKFEEEKFMKALVNLKDTQESIQSFSGWCIKNKRSAYKMARCWTKVIKKVRIEQKLVLFYLVNDVIQHSAKKGYTELLDKFRGAIKEAIPHLKEEKIANKVQRCLNIWDEREVFDNEYIKELSSLIDMTPVKEDQEIIENFQSNELCKQVKIMKALEDDADYKLKTLKENDMENKDINAIKAKLKDKSCGGEHVAQFEEGTRRTEAYIKAMEREVAKRKQVIELLNQGKKYYDSLYDEAEIVATAYTNFGNRVKKVQTRLEEKLEELKAPGSGIGVPGAGVGVPGSDSPVPSPDYDAPSPQGDDEMELKLPDEEEPGTPEGPPPTSPGGYTPPRSYTPPSRNLTDRLSSMDPSNFSRDVQDAIPPRLVDPRLRHQQEPPPPPPPREPLESTRHRKYSDSLRDSSFRSSRDSVDSITREAMTIPRDNISDFLTKIAHGEKLNIRSFESSSHDNGLQQPKRRRVSDSGQDSPDAAGSYARRSYSHPESVHHQNTGWAALKNDSFFNSQEEPEEEVVENLALERLKAKNQVKTGGSNLISLTSSPLVKDPDLDGKPMQPEDMELSDGEDGEIIESALEESWNSRNETSAWSSSRDEQHNFWNSRTTSDSASSSRQQEDFNQSWNQGRPAAAIGGSDSWHAGAPKRLSADFDNFPPRNSHSDSFHSGGDVPQVPPPPFSVPPPAVTTEPVQDPVLKGTGWGNNKFPGSHSVPPPNFTQQSDAYSDGQENHFDPYSDGYHNDMDNHHYHNNTANNMNMHDGNGHFNESLNGSDFNGGEEFSEGENPFANDYDNQSYAPEPDSYHHPRGGRGGRGDVGNPGHYEGGRGGGGFDHRNRGNQDFHQHRGGGRGHHNRGGHFRGSGGTPDRGTGRGGGGGRGGGRGGFDRGGGRGKDRGGYNDRGGFSQRGRGGGGGRAGFYDGGGGGMRRPWGRGRGNW